MLLDLAWPQFYFEYRAKSKVQCEDNPWKFQNTSLFQRLDAFLERCHDMMDMMSTCVQVSRAAQLGGRQEAHGRGRVKDWAACRPACSWQAWGRHGGVLISVRVVGLF